jgi:uncharacterized RDD family membrane protein YckC
MNTEVLDDSNFKEGELNIEYPTLGARFVASILDFLIVGVPMAILSFGNIFYLGSSLIAILLVFVFPVYKVYMEGTYGYTFGKKIQGFKIVKAGDGAGEEEMDMKTSMLRYLFGFSVLMFTLINTIYTFGALVEGGVESFSDFAARSEAVQAAVPGIFTTLANVANLVYFVAILFIFQGGKCQTLYDRIAKTICVVNKDK